MRIIDRLEQFLSDGLPHSREEIWLNCIDNYLPCSDPKPFHALQQQITLLRKKVEPQGKLVVCELHGFQIRYRMVRKLRSE